NTPQPDELLLVGEPGEVIMLHGCQEDLECEILSILPGSSMQSRISKDNRCIPLIECAVRAADQFVFALLLHHRLPGWDLTPTRTYPKTDLTPTRGIRPTRLQTGFRI